MVKEEDKGRGCVAVYWRDVFFSSGLLLEYSRSTAIAKWIIKKNPRCKVFFEIL
jgi:hypothetical protein